MIARGCPFNNRDDLMLFLRKQVLDNWWTNSPQRQRHLRAPIPIELGQILYRSDGACRGQGRDGVQIAGAGAACFDDNNNEIPVAWACLFLGEGLTNNIAEYEGVLLALRRIVRMMQSNVILEADNFFIVN